MIDSATWGLGSYAMSGLFGVDGINRCSTEYLLGMVAGSAIQIAAGAGGLVLARALTKGGLKTLGRAAAKGIDKSWKSKIHGKAQRTATPGHQFRSLREAIREAKNPNVVRVHLNHGYNRALGLPAKTIQPNRRPDIISVYRDGTVKRIEVKSKSDNFEKLLQRNLEVDRQLRDLGFNPTRPIIIP
jgi:hypothetical protein